MTKKEICSKLYKDLKEVLAWTIGIVLSLSISALLLPFVIVYMTYSSYDDYEIKEFFSKENNWIFSGIVVLVLLVGVCLAQYCWFLLLFTGLKG